eukprot:TRINITY_DN5464_c0_g1_i1.p1 TRINITY_DN5464_c0_g1~~TRINITY_DN5464_c0_g1_i1.p1  ORF type:complete len:630 (-),score=136.95 TRINITY_DN5464_c0_g1_i1:454-2343(-)
MLINRTKLADSTLRDISSRWKINEIYLRCMTEGALQNPRKDTSSVSHGTQSGFTITLQAGFWRIFRNNSCVSRNVMSNGVTLGQSRCLETASAAFGQRRAKTADEIEKEFAAASSVEELKSAFKAMESVFDENDKRLGLACLRTAQQFDSRGQDPEIVLQYAKRALNILQMDDKESITTAMALHLMGSVNYSLKKFDESMGYLTRSNKILEKLEKEGSNVQTKPVSCVVQMLLGDVKTAMGRREEALSNYTKSLALKEEVLDPNHPQLAVTYRQVAEAYVSILKFKEALPLCLKALEIHGKKLGDNSVEVAIDRRVLSVIYSGMGENKKALSENKLAKRVFINWGMSSEVINAELDSANVQIMLGKYEDAMETLGKVLKNTEKESKQRGMILLFMAKALCPQKKFADAKKCCEMASEIFSKYEKVDPIATAETFSEIALLYESTNELETAIKLYERALGLYEKSPQHQHTEASIGYRLGWLLLLTGSVPEAIPYLEKAAEKLKDSFGPNHYGVGYIYNNLGAAYEEIERPQAAAQMFSLAKTILENSLGPQHLDTIETTQNLAKVYALMGSDDIAIQMQQGVVEALEKYGPSVRDELKEAHRCLKDLENKIKQSSGSAARNARRFFSRV